MGRIGQTVYCCYVSEHWRKVENTKQGTSWN